MELNGSFNGFVFFIDQDYLSLLKKNKDAHVQQHCPSHNHDKGFLVFKFQPQFRQLSSKTLSCLREVKVNFSIS